MSEGLPKFISKLSIKEFGTHLTQYTNLYLKPIDSWKKAYSQRKSGYDFTILNLIYYSTLALLLIKDFYLTAQFVVLDVLLTFVPFIIFIIPFHICTKIFKIHKRWTKFFRVLLIIKFQLTPPLILIILFTQWSEIEIFYIIYNNGLWIMWLAFFSVIPMISFISTLKKVFWITLNYLFFIIGITLFSSLIISVDVNNELINKIQINNPNNEYQNFQLQTSFTINRIEDKNFIAIYKPFESNSVIVSKTQFSTPKLASIIIKNSTNNLIKKQTILDSILSKTDSSYIPKKYELYTVPLINIDFLDSINKETELYFYKDLNFLERVKDSSQFNSNKQYFSLYFDYLKHYEQLFINKKNRIEIISNLIPLSKVEIDSNQIVAYYELPNQYIFNKKEELISLKIELDEREFKSNFLLTIILYPIEKILELIEYD